MKNGNVKSADVRVLQAWTLLFRQSSNTIFQHKPSSLPATGNSSKLPIILGTVLGAVVLVVLVIILVVKKMKKPRVVPILAKEREAGTDI